MIASWLSIAMFRLATKLEGLDGMQTGSHEE